MAYKEQLIRTSSEDETIQAGRALAPSLKGVVLLSGDLGAGKTTLVRGIVSGIAGANAEEVSSPTFTLVHDYGAGVFHLDLYRLESEREIAGIGIDEILANARVALIEWGEKLERLKPGARTEIYIHDAGNNERVIRVEQKERKNAAGGRTT